MEDCPQKRINQQLEMGPRQTGPCLWATTPALTSQAELNCVVMTMSPLTVSVRGLTRSRPTQRLQQKANRDRTGNTSKASIHGPGNKDGEGSSIPTALA